MKIRTSRQWLTQLAALSSNIETINLTECKDADADLGVDALFLANDDVHTRFIANAIEKLCSSEASSLKEAKKLIRDIMSIKTYGAFSELAAYDWLLRNGLKITTQVYMHARDILGINGAHLDGKIDGFGTYFDVKGFGFPGHLAARLKKRLESELPGEVVLIENTWDVSVYQFEDLLNNPASLLQTLNQQRSAHIGDLFIRLEKPSPVIISRRTVSPYRLAKENATYPFLRANQFTRDSPFILIFVVHPWFNQSAISHDFHGVDGAFTRALARRAFMQLTNEFLCFERNLQKGREHRHLLRCSKGIVRNHFPKCMAQRCSVGIGSSSGALLNLFKSPRLPSVERRAIGPAPFGRSSYSYRRFC